MREPIEHSKVLVLVAHYIPFSKGGGPIVSVSNIVDRLSTNTEFCVITSDRDHGAKVSAFGVTKGGWVRVQGAKVFRVNPRRFGPIQFVRLAKETEAQVIYINSVFDAHFSIMPTLAFRVGLLEARRLVITPRGELHPGALGLKQAKKRVFLSVARRMGLYRGVRWHATSLQEADQIRKTFPNHSNDVLVVTNISAPPAPSVPAYPNKEAGILKLVFISRIVETKGLELALTCLHEVTADIQFDIYGPIEDAQYWRRCMQVAQDLPTNIRVSHHGAVEHVYTRGLLAEAHVFILPTLGENYGHAIVEALSAGRPAIISDQTPWLELEERGAGFALPLDTRAFTRAVTYFAEMDNSSYAAAAQAALSYSRHIYSEGDKEGQYMRLFASGDAVPSTK